MAYNVRIELLRAEISRRQSRRGMFKKMQYEGIIWFDYQGFSDELYHNVKYESQTARNHKPILKIPPFLRTYPDSFER